EHAGAHVAGADVAELARRLDFEIETAAADFTRSARADGLALFPTRGAVERDAQIIDAQPVEIQIHRQQRRRPGAENAEELALAGRLIELVFIDDHRLGPEWRDAPVGDARDRRAAVEGARDLGIIAGPDQPLGAED